MSYKNFKIIRLLLAFFIAITVSIAVSIENFYLAISAVIIGIILMLLIKKKVKVLLVDEMVKDIAGKSALMTYSIIVPILAILSLFFMFFNLGNQDAYLYNLGVIFSYIALLNIAIYSISYYYYRKKNGSDEE